LGRTLGKFLLLILIAIAAWWLAKGFRRSNPKQDTPDAAPEQMVNCGHCGLYLPRHEAVPQGDKFYCCVEHCRLAR